MTISKSIRKDIPQAPGREAEQRPKGPHLVEVVQPPAPGSVETPAEPDLPTASPRRVRPARALVLAIAVAAVLAGLAVGAYLLLRARLPVQPPAPPDDVAMPAPTSELACPAQFASIGLCK